MKTILEQEPSTPPTPSEPKPDYEPIEEPAVDPDRNFPDEGDPPPGHPFPPSIPPKRVDNNLPVGYAHLHI
ncbi:MAG: hypothetical protein AAB538_02615 [Patescibacteria group bacterium]